MGDAMEEGTVLRWLKNEGDSFDEEEEILEIETEKSTIAFPAPEAGTLTRILIDAGQTVPVGTVIGRYSTGEGDAVEDEEDAGEVTASGARPAAAAAAMEGDEEPAETEAATGSNGRTGRAAAAGETDREEAPRSRGRVKASPLARKVAAAHGIDVAGIAGTGPGGRIIEADVEEAVRSKPSAAPAPAPAAPEPAVPARAEGDQLRRMTAMRKVIARRLTLSKQTIPHFYLTLDVDMRKAVELRTGFNASVSDDRKISFNDLVIRAAALALVDFPNLYSSLDGDDIRTPAAINIGVAVSLEEGLVVPVLRDAPSLSVSRIGQEVRRLAGIARGPGLKPEDYSGGAFSISNLGMYDITQFQAVINPPEAAILAVGAIRDAAIVENGALVPGKQMHLTLSVDHRLVDGHVAALFMQRLKGLLEAPMALMG